MPIDLEKIKEIERQEQQAKLTPRVTKSQHKKIISNLTHWVVLDSLGRQQGGLFNKEEAESYILAHPLIDLPRIQKVICYPNIQCTVEGCTSNAAFYKYKFGEILYKCKSDHVIKISEYA